MTVKLITPPTVEPLTVAELKAWSRIDHAAEDSLLAGLIRAAREFVERHVGVQLITQTWQVSLAAFPASGCALELPLRPVQSVSSITYTDAAGAPQTLDLAGTRLLVDEWTTDLYLADISATWPSTSGAAGNVAITVVAGFGDAGTDVPETLRQAMSLIAAHWYENREESTPLQTRQIPMGAERLMGLHRVPRVGFA